MVETQHRSPRQGEVPHSWRGTIPKIGNSRACPAGLSVAMTPKKQGGHLASFQKRCLWCQLHERYTKSKSGRSIEIGTHEHQLHEARVRLTNPDLQRDCRETRPKVERKLAHLTRRLHGGRKARVRQLAKVTADFLLLVAAYNQARTAQLASKPRMSHPYSDTGRYTSPQEPQRASKRGGDPLNRSRIGPNPVSKLSFGLGFGQLGVSRG
ncbi:MAG: transposase [Actinomycetota bacterium]|nr:transposase [Actinomycetota bacterium]